MGDLNNGLDWSSAILIDASLSESIKSELAPDSNGSYNCGPVLTRAAEVVFKASSCSTSAVIVVIRFEGRSLDSSVLRSTFTTGAS